MFQVKFAVGNNSKKFLSNRQTKISDTLKERRFHFDLGGRAPLEWQWTYIWILPRKFYYLRNTIFFFFLNIPPRAVWTKGKASLFITRRTISRAPGNNALFEAKLVGAINFFFIFTTWLPSPPIDPSTKHSRFLPCLHCRPIFNRSDFVAKKM